jgi:hypothetical protein
MRMMAAKAILPGLKPQDLVTVVCLLAQSPDPEVANTADATLNNLPGPMLEGALGADLEPVAALELARRYAGSCNAVEQLLRQPRLPGEALEHLAEQATEQLGEIIATNETKLLAHPRAIEMLYMNRQVRMSTSDRLLELAVRNGLELDIPAFQEAAIAIKSELICEPTAEPTPDDVLFREADTVAAQAALQGAEDDTHDVDEEGEERLRDQFLPLYARINQMTVTQKIRRATLGNSAERLLLVRDSNKLVSRAAVKSPLLKENEAVLISASRNVDEEVLRLLAKNRDMTKSYQVKLNLVSNPRTPFAFGSQMVPHLRDSDLRSLAKSKNVPGAIAQAAKRHLSRKQLSKNGPRR